MWGQEFTQYSCGSQALFASLVPTICWGQESEHFAYLKGSPFVPLPERITAPSSTNERIAFRFASFRPLTAELISASVFDSSQLSRHSRIAWATRSASASLFSTPGDTIRETDSNSRVVSGRSVPYLCRLWSVRYSSLRFITRAVSTAAKNAVDPRIASVGSARSPLPRW